MSSSLQLTIRQVRKQRRMPLSPTPLLPISCLDDIPEHKPTKTCRNLPARACLTIGEAFTANLDGAFEVRLGALQVLFRFWCLHEYCNFRCASGAFHVRFSMVGDCRSTGSPLRLVRNPRNMLLMLVGLTSWLKLKSFSKHNYYTAGATPSKLQKTAVSPYTAF